MDNDDVTALDLVEARTTSRDLPEFRATVEVARQQRSAELLYNSSTAHAAILIENLFMAGERQINIVCRTLNPQSYGLPQVVDAARQFLSHEGASITVVAETVEENPAEEGNRFWTAFKDDQQVTFRVGEVPIDADFMTADGRAYRLEPNSELTCATANFNDKVTAGALNEVFDLVAPQVPLAA